MNQYVGKVERLFLQIIRLDKPDNGEVIFKNDSIFTIKIKFYIKL